MSKIREKAYTFTFGLLFGLIIAGSFFILKLDDYFKELTFYKKIAETLSTFNNEENEKNDSFNLTKNVKSKDTKKEKIQNESLKKNNISTGTMDLSVDSTSESNATENIINKLENVQSEEIIRKDELVISRTLHLTNLNPITKKISNDSILTKISGIDSDVNPAKMMSVEFWQSPLNFKGYKMSKYKIVVFGLKWREGIKIYKLEDAVVFKSGNTVYQLEYTSEFKAYKSVVDEIVLKQLK